MGGDLKLESASNPVCWRKCRGIRCPEVELSLPKVMVRSLARLLKSPNVLAATSFRTMNLEWNSASCSRWTIA